MKLYTILKNIITRAKAYTDTKFDQMADYIVEAVNNENSGYTKWASGKLECWKRVSMTINATTKWSNIYYGTTSGVDYPHAFSSLPVVNVTVQAHSGNVWMAQENMGQSMTNTNGFYVYSAVSQSNLSCTFNIQAVGKWK